LIPNLNSSFEETQRKRDVSKSHGIGSISNFIQNIPQIKIRGRKNFQANDSSKIFKPESPKNRDNSYLVEKRRNLSSYADDLNKSDIKLE
jgi:hypothetical protein